MSQPNPSMRGAEDVSDELAARMARQLVLENAAQFVRAIEERTSLVAAEVMQAIRRLLVRGVGKTARVDERRPRITLLPATAERLERYASMWASIVPSHVELRATVSLLLERRHGAAVSSLPAVALALSLAEPDVAAARVDFAADVATFVLSLPERPSEPEDDRRVLEGTVEREVRLVRLTKGQVLHRQGDKPDCFYIVISGRLQVALLDEEGQDQPFAEIDAGGTAGETEVLTDEPWPSTIRALRDSMLVALDSDACQRLIERYPRFLMAATHVVISRLKAYQTAARSAAQPQPRTIVVLPLSQDVPAHQFAAALAGALGQIAPARHLRRQLAEEALEHDGLMADTYDERLVTWLNEQEARFPFVVYQAEPELNGWTRRCLRQADRIMLLARAKDSPALSLVELQLARAPEGELRENVELVLLYDQDVDHPSGTRRWLEPRSVLDHHHARLGNRDDFGHLARRLTGQAVGLVLGGGGARAFASVGALLAIHESNLPIDLVGGTSGGSFFAAACALGWDQERMVEVVRTMMSTRRQTLDYTLPLVSLLAAGKMRRTLETLFGDTMIEDLWRPFFCVTSNLTRAEMMVHRSGLLRHYVRASCSVPTVFPPVLEGQDLLVDGMLLNNLPVDVMSNISRGGPIIAIDVSAKEDR
ncbi:MAG: patatin-like phospholipase family protein, partial [Chloroflexota bacterium]